ncbi:hypothetical protein BLNAU_22174 [Blattamonas nauphoetae]|uniref:Uncharacterized protein n=1 Tax=Blattamonas nauphoetae TaxID=2049346 RepID=A0ABQ9WTU4_9EUKA|nr:hypothetical protein BLNAU_22174 [Blattamonas nauphoetae]
MFDITNSTFSVSGVHAIMNSNEQSVCSISASIVRFSDSWITSSSDICPFLIRPSEHFGLPVESIIILSKIHRRSQTGSIGPFVGLADPHPQMVSSASTDWSDLPTTEMKAISVVGTDLLLDTQHLVSGTGPLFSFGMTEQGIRLATSRCALQMETSLIRSTLVNMTSSSVFSPDKQIFGSTVDQRMVGSCVRQSTNHESGTGMMSPNLGGNLMCLNTSFSSCIRVRNTDIIYSCENITQTHIGRLYSVSSEVTSITYTLCTFNEMAETVAPGWREGGAAMFISTPSSSLTVRSCFFHKCTCTGHENNLGGAIFYHCSSSPSIPLRFSASSFTECSTNYSAGSIYCYSQSSILMYKCFFQRSASAGDGAVNIHHADTVTIFNSAFVDCYASFQAGALALIETTTFSLSFSQFRKNLKIVVQNGRDVYIWDKTSSQITADMFQFCDSTSGAPNVYFEADKTDNNNFVPQISSTPTIKSVDVSFDGDEATVTVETEEAIRGTMGVLFNGSNVPRLVHVVFGDRRTDSTVGKGVVSSGSNGVLPSATYIRRNTTLAPFPIPAIRTAEAVLKDWNTTEIVLSGVHLEEGSYSVLIAKESNTFNITLTRSCSRTLVGTAPLYPSTAEGRLEWSTEYKVMIVMCLPDGEQQEEQVELKGSVTFTTPAEPPRIESVGCSLNGKKDMAIVELIGRALSSSGHPVVTSGSSGEVSSSGGIFNVTSTNCFVNFSIGSSEDSSHVVFGGRYELLSVGTDSSSFAVNSGLFFEVPHPPRISSIAAPSEVSSSTFVLSVSGEYLPSGSTFTVTLTSGHICTVSFSSASSGTSTIGIGGGGEVQYNTNYFIQSVIRTESGKDDEHILFPSTPFRTPRGPTLSSISCDFSSSNPNILNLSLSTARMPLEDFTLKLKTTQSPSETIHLAVSPYDLSTGFVLVEVGTT